VRFRQIGVERQRLAGFVLGALAPPIDFGGGCEPQIHVGTGHRQAGARQRIAWIAVQRRLERLDGEPRVVRCVLDERGPPTQVIGVRSVVARIAATQPILLGRRKAQAILDARPDVVATANPGCALQLTAALRDLGWGDLPVVHPVELLPTS